MSELFFDDCEIPVEHLIGREGAGKNLFTDSMTWERSCILASAVGAMQRLLDASVRYANERKQFGQPIARFQLVASRLVDMKLRLETSRALLYRAGWMKARGRSIFLEAALARLHISESWVASAQGASRSTAATATWPSTKWSASCGTPSPAASTRARPRSSG